jgi:hypothetical protein
MSKNVKDKSVTEYREYYVGHCTLSDTCFVCMAFWNLPLLPSSDEIVA